jgi:hypothetical protein
MSYVGVGAAGARYQLLSSGCMDMQSSPIKQVDKSLCSGSQGDQPASKSWWEKIFGYGKQGLDVYAQGQQQQGVIKAGQAAAIQSGGAPSWLLPVGLVAVGLGAILVLTKKRRAPQENPAKRRRRRRR